jgi:amino acid transporter
LSIFVLRRRDPGVERSFKVPLYPLLPVIFVVVCAYMLWSSLSYVYSQELGGLNAAWIGVGVLVIGAGLLFFVRGSGPPSHEPALTQTTPRRRSARDAMSPRV